MQWFRGGVGREVGDRIDGVLRPLVSILHIRKALIPAMVFSRPETTEEKILWIKSMLKQRNSIQAYPLPPTHPLPSKTHQNQPLPQQTFLALSS